MMLYFLKSHKIYPILGLTSAWTFICFIVVNLIRSPYFN